MSKQKSKAIDRVNECGVLLVFPVKNQKEPNSLWKELHPRTPMRWEWSEEGDDRVMRMWQLMKELSGCREIIYSKWYQGRATFFSTSVFKALIKHYNDVAVKKATSHESRILLETLREDSPLSTKQLKSMTDLQGKFNESRFHRGLRELFRQFLVVGYGEVEDGAFPSALWASTELIYEDLWNQALHLNSKEAEETMEKYLPKGSAFRKFYDRCLKA